MKMSNDFNNSLFNWLPNEVLIKILSEVNTSTLLNFCEVYECDYFLQDRNVIETIDLQKNYDLRDFSQISKKIAFEYVTTLNVNCLYWIQAAELREFVTRLTNLETLYALQTNLSLVSSDTEVFSKSKIKKLGVCVRRHDELGNHKIPTVETLYLNLGKVTTLVTTIETIFPNLRSLWIDLKERYCFEETILQCLNTLNSESKSKIFCQVEVKTSIPAIDFDHYGLTTYYNDYRFEQPSVMCCEKFDAGQVRSKTDFDIDSCLGSWKVLDELYYCTPYGPKDARRLFLGENTLDDIFFDELNFDDCSCSVNRNKENREAVNEILKSPCAQRLKKLCVTACLFENENARESVDIHNGFSRKRIALEKSVSSHPVQEVFNNFLELEHLEIHVCPGASHHSAIQAYSLISLFENLQSLTLKIPETSDGSFLIEILKKCKRIGRLIITTSGNERRLITTTSGNERLNDNVCEAISNATSLKDFRYESYDIPLDKLIERLCLVKTKKLQRIVLIGSNTFKLRAGPLKEFLDINPQLVFLYFLIERCTEFSLTMVQQILSTYKEQHPAKVFFCEKTDPTKLFLRKKRNVFNTIDYPIPDVHYCEMIKTESNVASLRPLEDFETF